MNPTDLINVENPGELISFLMPIILVALAIFFLVMAIVLSYHWRKYGVGKVRAAIFMWTYLIGGIVFLSVMVTSKLSY